MTIGAVQRSSPLTILTLPDDIKILILDFFARAQRIILPVYSLRQRPQSVSPSSISKRSPLPSDVSSWERYWIIHHDLRASIAVSRQFRQEVLNAIVRNVIFEFRYEDPVLRSSLIPAGVHDLVHRTAIGEVILKQICDTEDVTPELIRDMFPSLKKFTLRMQWNESHKYDRPIVKRFLSAKTPFATRMDVSIRYAFDECTDISILPDKTVYLYLIIPRGRSLENYVESAKKCLWMFEALGLDYSAVATGIDELQAALETRIVSCSSVSVVMERERARAYSDKTDMLSVKFTG